MVIFEIYDFRIEKKEKKIKLQFSKFIEKLIILNKVTR